MNIIKQIKKYIAEVRDETKKVSWPSKQQAIRDSIVVVGISIATAIFLGGVDYLLSLIDKLVIVQ